MEHSFYKLSSGADVFNSLDQLKIHTNSTSFLISAVGDLSGVSFKCPLNEKPIRLEKKLEVITLSGYLTSEESHIHISVSDDNCNVFGGHLLPGTTVHKSLEILLGVVPDIKQKNISSVINSNPSVDVYVLPNCPWSKRALEIFDKHQIKYHYHLVTNDKEFNEISSKTSINTFPQIFINNKFIGGYSDLADLSKSGKLIELF